VETALFHQVEEGVGLAQAKPRQRETLPAEARPALDVDQLGAGGGERARPAAQHGGGNHLCILESRALQNRSGVVTITPAPAGSPPGGQEAAAASTG
jgi:hypothetical protein